MRSGSQGNNCPAPYRKPPVARFTPPVSYFVEMLLESTFYHFFVNELNVRLPSIAPGLIADKGYPIGHYRQPCPNHGNKSHKMPIMVIPEKVITIITYSTMQIEG